MFTDRDLLRMTGNALGGKEKIMEAIKDVIRLLVQRQPLPPELDDHDLEADYKGCRECKMEDDWLLIYKVEGNTLRLVRTGSHTELFKSWRRRRR